MEREKKERREGKEEGERDGEKRRGREGREEREKGEREREERERDAISWLWGVNFLVSVPGCYTENDHMGLVFLMPLCT